MFICVMVHLGVLSTFKAGWSLDHLNIANLTTSVVHSYKSLRISDKTCSITFKIPTATESTIYPRKLLSP